MIDLLRKQFAESASWKYRGERNDRLYCNIDELKGEAGLLTEQTALKILRRVPRPLIKTHAWPGLEQGFRPSHPGLRDSAWQAWLNKKASWIYVWRDVQAVMCSYYLFCIGAGIINASLPMSAFIRQRDSEDRTRVRVWADHVCCWTSRGNVTVLNFAQILSEPRTVIQYLGNVLSMEPRYREPLLPRPFQSVWESRRSRLFGICPQSTAIINKGKLEGHQVFSSEDLEFMADETGKIPVQMGDHSS